MVNEYDDTAETLRIIRRASYRVPPEFMRGDLQQLKSLYEKIVEETTNLPNGTVTIDQFGENGVVTTRGQFTASQERHGLQVNKKKNGKHVAEFYSMGSLESRITVNQDTVNQDNEILILRTIGNKEFNIPEIRIVIHPELDSYKVGVQLYDISSNSEKVNIHEDEMFWLNAQSVAEADIIDPSQDYQFTIYSKNQKIDWNDVMDSIPMNRLETVFDSFKTGDLWYTLGEEGSVTDELLGVLRDFLMQLGIGGLPEYNTPNDLN